MSLLYLILISLSLVNSVKRYKKVAARLSETLNKEMYKQNPTEMADTIKQFKAENDLIPKKRYFATESFKSGQNEIKINFVVFKTISEDYVFFIPPKGQTRKWLEDENNLVPDEYKLDRAYIKIQRTKRPPDVHFDLLGNTEKWWGNAAWLSVSPKVDITGFSYGKGASRRALEWLNEFWLRYGINQAFIEDHASLTCGLVNFVGKPMVEDLLSLEEARYFRILRVFEDKTISIYNYGGYTLPQIYDPGFDLSEITKPRTYMLGIALGHFFKELKDNKNPKYSEIHEAFWSKLSANPDKYVVKNPEQYKGKNKGDKILKPSVLLSEALLEVKKSNCIDYVHLLDKIINAKTNAEDSKFKRAVDEYVEETKTLVFINIDKTAAKPGGLKAQIYSTYESKYQPLQHKSAAAAHVGIRNEHHWSNHDDSQERANIAIHDGTYGRGTISDEYYHGYGSYNDYHNEYAVIGAMASIICIGCCCFIIIISIIGGFISGKFYEMRKNQKSKSDRPKYEIVDDHDNEDQI